MKERKQAQLGNLALSVMPNEIVAYGYSLRRTGPQHTEWDGMGTYPRHGTKRKEGNEDLISLSKAMLANWIRELDKEIGKPGKAGGHEK